MKLINQWKSGRHLQKLRTSNTQPPEAVSAAIEHLVQLGNAAIEPVIECLGHGEARIPVCKVLERLLNDDSLSIYLEALSSSNPAVVSGVAGVLSRSKNYDVSRIVGLLSDPSLPKASIESILWEQIDSLSSRRLIGMVPELGKDALAVVFRLVEKIADETVGSDLMNLVDHEDWWVRLNVAKLLGDCKDQDVAKGLTRLLKDSNKNVRLEAVKGIHKLRPQKSVPALAQRLRDQDLKVQTAAIDALVDFADASAVPHLIEVLKDESEYARRAAVEVLNEVATPAAIQDLVRALRDEDWWVRVRAADALGSLGGNKVVDGVVGLLQDPDDFIRRYAVEILNSIPSRRAVNPLIQALEDADWWVRERAIDALAKAGDGRAVGPLLDLLRQDIAAAPHCIRALGILGDARAVEPLAGMILSENDEIRREVGDALVAFSRMELSEGDRGLVKEALARAKINPGKAGHSPRGVRGHDAFGPEAVAPADPDRSPFSVRTTIPGKTPAETSPPESRTPSSGAQESSDSSSPGAEPTSKSHNFHKLERDAVLLDRFRVLRQIGRGGFGSIYLVEDAAIKEELILKILNPQLSMDDNAILRFVQELKLTRRITHENVIRIYDFMDLGGARAVSMEYFPSRDLGKILRSEGALPPRRGLAIVDQILEGMAAAHGEGVIHRDIKPANILVGNNDDVKIVDFGLASMEQRMGSRLTRSGILIGTPEYMAPEQISDSEVDHRVDIYSMGVMMYEMFSGEKPFTAETPVKVLFLHLEGQPVPLAERAPELPPALVDLVNACMAKKPEERPATSVEIRQTVQSILAGLAEAA